MTQSTLISFSFNSSRLFAFVWITQRRKTKIRRMISGLLSIRRWRWGAFRCAWNGVPRAASTDHPDAHTAPCATTVSRYTHISTVFRYARHRVGSLYTCLMHLCVWIFRSLTITVHGWITASGGGTTVISSCSFYLSPHTSWECSDSACCTSSVTPNSWTKCTLELRILFTQGISQPQDKISNWFLQRKHSLEKETCLLVNILKNPHTPCEFL